MKGIFSNRSYFFQTGFFVYLLLMGYFMSSSCGFAIINIAGTQTDLSCLPFYLQHTLQFFANLFIFALPATGTAYFCSKQPAQFLGLKKINDIRVVIISVLMLVFLFPAIDLTAYFNAKMQLPDFMAPIENRKRASEDFATELTERLLAEKGFFPLITNILVMGIMAGLTEELLFRGALLSLIRKKIKNPHLPIWTVAVIFSVLHFQFYGFIPRLLLGAFFGYLYYWSHSIWLPILAHFLNNTSAIVAYKAGFSSANTSFITEETSANTFIAFCLIAVVGLALFYFCAKYLLHLYTFPSQLKIAP
jgi:membrane protease YdiL (CAAX protease family)